MKLYVTSGSPYARIGRMMVLEEELESRVEIIVAQTRQVGSPYYRIIRSGRAPYLLCDDGVGLEDSALICHHFDCLDGRLEFDLPEARQGWEARRLGALARSMLNGLTVWVREVGRPQNERSPTVIPHEASRSRRMADTWELEIAHPWMCSATNLEQITLACAVGLETRIPEFQRRGGLPGLCSWFERIAARPSFAATALDASA